MDHVTILRQVKVNQNVDLKMVLGKNIEIEKVNKEGNKMKMKNEKWKDRQMYKVAVLELKKRTFH